MLSLPIQTITRSWRLRFGRQPLLRRDLPPHPPQRRQQRHPDHTATEGDRHHDQRRPGQEEQERIGAGLVDLAEDSQQRADEGG